jgi:HPt (histidine-containing phosphotransfer) domain-containing protein
MLDEGVLAELRTSVQGDTGFVRELVDAYVADSAILVDAIEAAVADADADALVRPAHTLKSSSATLGAMTVSGMARTLEAAGRSGSLDGGEVRDAAEGLRGEWDAATAALRDWLARAGSP